MPSYLGVWDRQRPSSIPVLFCNVGEWLDCSVYFDTPLGFSQGILR